MRLILMMILYVDASIVLEVKNGGWESKMEMRP